MISIQSHVRALYVRADAWYSRELEPIHCARDSRYCDYVEQFPPCTVFVDTLAFGFSLGLHTSHSSVSIVTNSRPDNGLCTRRRDIHPGQALVTDADDTYESIETQVKSS